MPELGTTTIYCRHVIVAVGGLSVPDGCCLADLHGILHPCYSYLAHVPIQKTKSILTYCNSTQVKDDEILLYCATVALALLKCRPFMENENKSMELLSMQRFTHHLPQLYKV